MSTRTDRMADLIRDEISRMLLRDLRDPRLGFVTLTGASVSPDMRNVRVFISVLGDEKARAGSLKALRSASGLIQRTLFKNLGLRYAPTIGFALDDSLERGERIERVLREIHGDSGGERGGDPS
ncbi:MAG TPA: 30S ribosome-binding factor RbfA [Candidatus Polarisedimenticolia bacterium]|nr:30S ribosome-binding factor RbfA [Candidatus Polarisedimenticolia bacterium]